MESDLNPAAAPSFEESLARLDAIVQQLEDGELGLAESLAQYEAGVSSLAACYAMLQHAQRRIELLTGVDAEGNPITTAFVTAESEASATPATKKRSRRPPAAPPEVETPPPANDMDGPGRLF